MENSPINPPPFVPDDSPSNTGPVFDDMPDWRPRKALKKHIYEQYFTPAERRRLKAIPENDVTSEIYLLRVYLARIFEQTSRASDNKNKSSLPLKIDLALCSNFSHTAIVIASLAALQNKSHSLRSEWDRDVHQALREMNPYEDLE